MKNHTWKYLYLFPLVLIILFIVFPLEWLGIYWHALGSWLSVFFPGDSQHALGHTGLFCLLGLTALILLPVLRRRPYLYACLLLVGMVQEGLQLLYKQRPLQFDDWRDLGTDILGLLIAYILFWIWHTYARSIRKTA